MAKRKEQRRLKKINTYSREYTGEQNEHGWFTPKRFKALGQFVEATRNLHPGTFPIKPELKKEIGEKFTEDADWNYYVYRNYITQAREQERRKASSLIEDEVTTLPAHFRDEINNGEEEEGMPKLIHPQFLYNQQQNLIMPEDERYRVNLLLKLENPPEDKNTDMD